MTKLFEKIKTNLSKIRNGNTQRIMRACLSLFLLPVLMKIGLITMNFLQEIVISNFSNNNIPSLGLTHLGYGLTLVVFILKVLFVSKIIKLAVDLLNLNVSLLKMESSKI